MHKPQKTSLHAGKGFVLVSFFSPFIFFLPCQISLVVEEPLRLDCLGCSEPLPERLVGAFTGYSQRNILGATLWFHSIVQTVQLLINAEEWLTERLLVSSDLTDVFIDLYFWSDTILTSKAQITHYRWGRKLGLDWKFPDGAEAREAIGLIPRFSPTPEAACAYAASLHLLWEGRSGSQNCRNLK